MQLSELLNQLTITSFSGDGSQTVTGITCDSREVQPGNVFVCIKGYQSDGHKYVETARQKGAMAVIAQDPITTDLPVIYVSDSRLALAAASNWFFRFPAKGMRLIGVTGTNGKTTVTYLIKTILEHAGKKVGLMGTNQNMIGDTVLPAGHTTPEAPVFYSLLRQMADAGVEYVVMEVSSHALVQNRIAGCRFETAVFTNLTQDHLDFHKDMEQYYAAKRSLFDLCDQAVINIDDAHGKRLAKEVSCPVVTFAMETQADLHARDIKVSARGVTFLANYRGEAVPLRLGIPGRFSVYNALAAMGASVCLGFGVQDVTKGLVIAKGVKGRAELVPTGRDYTVLIDYAHSPDGLQNIISTVREFAAGRVITLFGCGGDRDRDKRPKMGQVAGELSDFCVITTDNPRSEPPEQIIAQIVEGLTPTGCAHEVIPDRIAAIHYALDHAAAGDVIILAGKGHETYQILADQTVHLDEREVVTQYLAQ